MACAVVLSQSRTEFESVRRSVSIVCACVHTVRSNSISRRSIERSVAPDHWQCNSRATSQTAIYFMERFDDVRVDAELCDDTQVVSGRAGNQWGVSTE